MAQEAGLVDLLDGLEDERSCVVDKHVERAVRGDHGLEQALEIVFFRYVGLDGDRLGAVSGDVPDDRV